MMRALAIALTALSIFAVVNCSTNQCEEDCIAAQEKCGDPADNLEEACSTSCFNNSSCTECWSCQAVGDCRDCRTVCDVADATCE